VIAKLQDHPHEHPTTAACGFIRGETVFWKHQQGQKKSRSFGWDFFIKALFKYEVKKGTGTKKIYKKICLQITKQFFYLHVKKETLINFLTFWTN